MRGRLLPVLCAAIALAVAGVAASKHAEGSSAQGSTRTISPAVRAAGLRFEPSVAEGDRQAILTAIAAARPEARTLVDLVDGLVNVRVGAIGGRAVGLTETEPNGYRVTLDLGTVSRRFGDRGIERLVLHELGHVIDHALVSDATVDLLDHEIPTGLGCEQGTMGACAEREERFAETFAKWALGDIGVNLDIGYKVPPPSVGLDAWGAPLAAIAARATAR
jgi:hypothetical protein